MADLSIQFSNIKFKNPVWLSSSEATCTSDKMKRGIDSGAGAVVAKSYSGAYFSGHEQKRLKPLAKFLALGYDRKPVYGKNIPKFFTLYTRSGVVQWCPFEEDKWIEELVKTQKYANKFDAYVIGSIFGSQVVDDMTRLAKKMEQGGLKMLELNLSCPHVDVMMEKGGLVKISNEYFQVTKEIVESVSIPVFVKLAAQQADLAATAKVVREAGAAGVTCQNRFMGLCIDIDNAKPFSWGIGGVGGPWVLPISLGWVSSIHKQLPGFPILGSNGAYDWQDVVQFHMAGANAVEFCASVMVDGYAVIRRAVKGLNDFLDAHGYKSVHEIIGIATQASRTYEEMYILPEYIEKASVNTDKCIGCGKCLEVCWYGGMKKINGHCRVDESKCQGCYNCRIVCPVDDCISITAARGLR